MSFKTFFQKIWGTSPSEPVNEPVNRLEEFDDYYNPYKDWSKYDAPALTRQTAKTLGIHTCSNKDCDKYGGTD
jgi:hypothetical protein